MKYSYIIVGGGSAGCVMASRLSEDPEVTVLLLEAGPDYPVFETLPDDLKLGNNVWLSAYGPHSWAYRGHMTSDLPDLEIPRGRATGGSSAINGQVLLRGIPEDYDRWAEWGNDEWGFTQCLPYFNKMETDLDFGGSTTERPEGEPPPVLNAYDKATGAIVHSVELDRPPTGTPMTFLVDGRQHIVLAYGTRDDAGLMALALQSEGLMARSWLGWQLPIETDDALGRPLRLTWHDVKGPVTGFLLWDPQRRLVAYQQYERTLEGTVTPPDRPSTGTTLAGVVRIRLVK